MGLEDRSSWISVTAQLWSISTTVIQVRIKEQLNSVLFAKTLVRKDVAGGGGAEKKDGDVKGMLFRDSSPASSILNHAALSLSPSRSSSPSLASPFHLPAVVHRP